MLSVSPTLQKDVHMHTPNFSLKRLGFSLWPQDLHYSTKNYYEDLHNEKLMNKHVHVQLKWEIQTFKWKQQLLPAHLISWHLSNLSHVAIFPTHPENIVHGGFFPLSFLQIVLVYNHVFSKLKS